MASLHPPVAYLLASDNPILLEKFKNWDYGCHKKTMKVSSSIVEGIYPMIHFILRDEYDLAVKESKSWQKSKMFNPKPCAPMILAMHGIMENNAEKIEDGVNHFLSK